MRHKFSSIFATKAQIFAILVLLNSQKEKTMSLSNTAKSLFNAIKNVFLGLNLSPNSTKTPKNSHLNSNQTLTRSNSAQIQPKMPLKVLIFSALLLSGIIVLANFTVQFQILGTPLTFGALTYPFSFLVLDILSEKYSKKETIKALALGLLLAFYPSYLSATPQIALASIAAFCISQPLDVLLFFTFKRLAPRFWWLRGISSTLIAQLLDTLIFFTIAFWGVQSLANSLVMAVADYSIKALLGFVNVPLFWYFAIYPLRKNFKTKI